MPIGQGHEHYGRSAKGQGSNPMKLLAPEVDDDTDADRSHGPSASPSPVGER